MRINKEVSHSKDSDNRSLFPIEWITPQMRINGKTHQEMPRYLRSSQKRNPSRPIEEIMIS
jgi:hypothetical protein